MDMPSFTYSKNSSPKLSTTGIFTSGSHIQKTGRHSTTRFRQQCAVQQKLKHFGQHLNLQQKFKFFEQQFVIQQKLFYPKPIKLQLRFVWRRI